MAKKKEETSMLDPVAYRSDYNPNNIKEEYRDDPNIPGVGPQNANLNYNAYGDDSNPEWQSQRGGLNPKYEGEGVSNTYIDYDPNLRTSDLDPNYLYGENARQQNRQEAGYIARRNDQIASALYNEGLTSREDVENYLSQQGGWMDSTEADRVNTIDSIWKRLGEKAAEPTTTPDGGAEAMEEEFNNKQEDTLYGKNTPNEGNPEEGIPALNDQNLAFQQTQQSRVAKLKELESMDVSKVAYLISEGNNIFDEQTMRDLQQYNPARYQAIMAEVKKIQSQNVIDQISTNGTINMSDATTAAEDNVTTSMNNFVNSTAKGSAAGTLATNLNNALAESEIVSGAREQMEVYKRKMVDIQQSIDELPSLANNYFKGDVPQYIVNAFINNRMQKYQKELEKYQNLYNASLDEAKWEVSQNQWREEMNYKWMSFQADENYRQAQLELNKKKENFVSGNWNKDGTYSYVDLDGNIFTLTPEQAKAVVGADLEASSTEFIDYWLNKLETAKQGGMHKPVVFGGQCESFTDNYSNQYWGVTMVGDGHTWTTAAEKAAYATEALPKKGYIAVWNYKTGSEASVKYGHTGIVIDYDPLTGKFTTLESNHDGKGEVSVQTHSINEINLQGFWDPSGGATSGNSKSNNVSSSFYYYDTPMHSKFVEMKSKYGEVAEERAKIDAADQYYSDLYDVYRNGYIDKVVGLENDDSDNMKKFIEMLNNKKYYDDGENAIGATLENAIRKELGEDYAYLYTRLRRIIEIKLRKESGAAINQSEWQGNFQQYLPGAGQGPEFIYNKLRALELDVVPGNMPSEERGNYISIFPETYNEYLKIRNSEIAESVEELTKKTMEQSKK